MSFVLALDQGTTVAARSCSITRARSAASRNRNFAQIFPQPGWVEHDPEEIWATQIGRRRRGAGQRRHRRRRHRRASASPISARRRSLWERATGKPVANAIVWQRPAHRRHLRRAAAPTGHEPTVRAQDRPGARCLFLRHQDQVAARQRRRAARSARERGELAFGTVDSWLIWQLTGGAVHVTDASQRQPHAAVQHPHAATGTTNCWRCSTCRARCCRRSSLVERRLRRTRRSPRPRDPDRRHRRRPAGGALRPGLLRARHGQEHLRHRLLPAAEHRRRARSRRRNSLLTTVAWQRDGRIDYALEGSVFIAGAVVQWLRDGLEHHPKRRPTSRRWPRACPTPAASTSCRRSSASARRTGIAYARGAIVGLTRGTTAAHIARAALESIAYQTRRRAARDARPTPGSRSPSCASTAAPPRTTC